MKIERLKRKERMLHYAKMANPVLHENVKIPLMVNVVEEPITFFSSWGRRRRRKGKTNAHSAEVVAPDNPTQQSTFATITQARAGNDYVIKSEAYVIRSEAYVIRSENYVIKSEAYVIRFEDYVSK